MSHKKERRPQHPKSHTPKGRHSLDEFDEPKRPRLNEEVPEIVRCIDCGGFFEVDDLDEYGCCEKCAEQYEIE